MFRDIIIGGGEVGHSLYHLFDKRCEVYDINPRRCILPQTDAGLPVDRMHVTIPHTLGFRAAVLQMKEKFEPRMIVIHSTVPVGTTVGLQCMITDDTPLVYAPARGVHERFVSDMRTYTKIWASAIAIDATKILEFESMWNMAGVRTNEWGSVKELELAKVLIDTTYYGWLIAFRFAADNIAKHYGVNPEHIWDFAEEIHQELGNRPKMFSNVDGIGGHCVLPNLELNNDPMSEMIRDTINKINFQHRRDRPQ